MFPWVSLFLILAKLTLKVLSIIERKQLLDQVQTDVLNQLRNQADAAIGSIDDTISNVSNTPDNILLDPANRDQQGSGNPDKKGDVPGSV